MPIYEYECPKCGQFELIRKFSDPPLKKCPTCKKAIKKLMSNTSFQLKGSGWYITDYARKSGGGGSGSGSSGSASGSDSGDSGGTTKTEAKADPAPAPKSEPKSEPKKNTPTKSDKSSAAAA